MGTAAVLSSRAIRGMFIRRHEEVRQALWVPVLGHTFRSDQILENYNFLGPVGPMREWEGGRRVTQLKDFGIEVRNKKYEKTISFPVDDLRRDKTDQTRIRIGEMASRAAVLPQRVFTTLLEGNGTAYDGIAYFGDHSSSRGPRLNNALTDSTVADAGKPTSEEMAQGILEIIQEITGATDPEGEPENEFANDFVIMVPTKYRSAAHAALKNEFTSAGVSNTLMAQDLRVRVITNPRLTAPATGGTGVFYGFRIDADVKPLIWQDEVESDFKALTEGSANEFFDDEHLFGAKRIGAGALAAYQMSARMTFS